MGNEVVDVPAYGRPYNTGSAYQVESTNSVDNATGLRISPESNVEELYFDKRIRIGFIPALLNKSEDLAIECKVAAYQIC